MKPWLMILILALGIPSGLEAAMNFQGFTKNLNLVYDPVTGLNFTGTLTVRHRGAATNYFITFAAGGSGTFTQRLVTLGTGTLNYQVTDSTSTAILKDLTGAPGPSEILSGSLPASGGWQTQTQNYKVTVPLGQFNLAGLYRDTLTVNLYSGTPGAPVLEDTDTLKINITVNTILQISLVDSGTGFNFLSTNKTLDFGTLVPGDQRALDTMVRANVSYTITLTSAAGGVLTSPGITDQIPYTLTFSGTPLTLSPGLPVTLVTGVPLTTTAGTAYPVRVTIGTLGTPAAGTYTDSLTFTVTTP